MVLEIKQQGAHSSASIFNWRVGQAIARQAAAGPIRLNRSATNQILPCVNAYADTIKGYKEMAAGRRAMRKYNIVEISKAIQGMIAYVKECANRSEPATIAGLILASGTNKDFFYKAKAGQYDYITLEYIDLNAINEDTALTDQDGILYVIDSQNNKIILSLCSDVIEKCLLIMESDLQLRSLTDKSMARTTGAIFNLKAVFNYNDKPEETKNVTNNTLIVNASPDQAAKAMQLLLKDK